MNAGTLRSDPVYFQYAAPKIDLLTTKTGPGGLLQITLRGSNFCSGKGGCGQAQHEQSIQWPLTSAQLNSP